MPIAEELTKLGKEIQSAKNSVAQLEGRKAEVMDRIKKDFDCNSVEDAEKLLDEMTIELEEINKTIEQDFNKLKENFSW